MNGVPRDNPADKLRVSDADRDRAISELSEHFQAGRLTSDEFDERSGLALRARTGGDLSALFADLPRPQAPAMPPAVGPGVPVPRPPGPLLAMPVAIAFAVMAAIFASGHGDHFTGALVPVLIVLFVLFRPFRGTRRRGGPRGPR